MAPKKDGPPLEKRPATNPHPPKDFGTDAAEVAKAVPPGPSSAVSTPTPKSKQQVYVVQLNTRVAHPYKEMLQALSAEQGTTIRQLIEQALDRTYGKPEGL